MIFTIFSQLQGFWQFTRLLRNENSHLLGKVSGKAAFYSTGQDILLYQESGELILKAGNILKVENEYVYAYLIDEDKIQKYSAQNGKKVALMYFLEFRDNLGLHTSLLASGEHLCQHDHYQASYEFNDVSFNEFNSTYRVTGPNKNYILETSYERA